MRVKTSVTLPEELLTELDRLDDNRSAVLERAARLYLARVRKEERDRRDLELINKNAAELNREAAAFLKLQNSL